MEKITDPSFLKESQYHDSSNLSKRASLHKDYGTNPINWQRWLMEKIELPDQALILELGCGPGYLWQENRITVPAGWKITLTDISGGMLREARASLRGKNQYFYLVVDAMEIPFPEGQFDAVIANHMLYHVRKIDKTLARIKKALKPEGFLLAATNGPSHLKELKDLERRFFPDQDSKQNYWALSFNLENGTEILSKHFSRNRRFDYPNLLKVNDPTAIINYLKSKSDEDLESEIIDALSADLDLKIKKKGWIEITAQAGVFISRR